MQTSGIYDFFISNCTRQLAEIKQSEDDPDNTRKISLLFNTIDTRFAEHHPLPLTQKEITCALKTLHELAGNRHIDPALQSQIAKYAEKILSKSKDLEPGRIPFIQHKIKSNLESMKSKLKTNPLLTPAIGWQNEDLASLGWPDYDALNTSKHPEEDFFCHVILILTEQAVGEESEIAKKNFVRNYMIPLFDTCSQIVDQWIKEKQDIFQKATGFDIQKSLETDRTIDYMKLYDKENADRIFSDIDKSTNLCAWYYFAQEQALGIFNDGSFLIEALGESIGSVYEELDSQLKEQGLSTSFTEIATTLVSCLMYEKLSSPSKDSLTPKPGLQVAYDKHHYTQILQEERGAAGRLNTGDLCEVVFPGFYSENPTGKVQLLPPLVRKIVEPKTSTQTTRRSESKGGDAAPLHATQQDILIPSIKSACESLNFKEAFNLIAQIEDNETRHSQTIDVLISYISHIKQQYSPKQEQIVLPLIKRACKQLNLEGAFDLIATIQDNEPPFSKIREVLSSYIQETNPARPSGTTQQDAVIYPLIRGGCESLNFKRAFNLIAQIEDNETRHSQTIDVLISYISHIKQQYSPKQEQIVLPLIKRACKQLNLEGAFDLIATIQDNEPPFSKIREVLSSYIQETNPARPSGTTQQDAIIYPLITEACESLNFKRAFNLIETIQDDETRCSETIEVLKSYVQKQSPGSPEALLVKDLYCLIEFLSNSVDIITLLPDPSHVRDYFNKAPYITTALREGFQKTVCMLILEFDPSSITSLPNKVIVSNLATPANLCVMRDVDQASINSSFPNGKDTASEFSRDWIGFDLFATIIQDDFLGPEGLITIIKTIYNKSSSLIDSYEAEEIELFYEIFSLPEETEYQKLSKEGAYETIAEKYKENSIRDLNQKIQHRLLLGYLQDRLLDRINNLKPEDKESILRDMFPDQADDLIAMDKSIAPDSEGWSLDKLLSNMLKYHHIAKHSSSPVFFDPEPESNAIYKRDKHTEILSPGGRAFGRIQEGDQVMVVLPGIYFLDIQDGVAKRALAAQSLVKRVVQINPG